MIRRSACIAACLLLLAAPRASALEPPADPYFHSRGSWGQDWDDQWAIKDVGLTAGSDSAWRKVRADGSDVVVAVIDTGLDWNHRDISWNNLWRNPGEVPDNGIDDDKNGYVDDVIGWDFFAQNGKPWDHDGHGTFIAGMIAATWNDSGVAGINPKAKLMILKAANNFGHSRASFLAQAIVYAADHGARIINLSIGGEGTTDIERDAIAYAWKKGAVIVAASGNESVDIADYGVAAYPEVLLVGATDFNGDRAVFSNWGRNLDLAAPGLDALSLRARRTDLMRDIPDLEYEAGSAYVGTDKRYYRSAGTSFSAPIVSGVASLLLVNRPKLTNEQVVRILLQSARDVEVPGVDQFTGYGVVDARAALDADPAFYVDAAIADVQVVQRGAGMGVQVLGTASADGFGRARLAIGAGEEPTEWKPVAGEIGKPVRGGLLGEIPAADFAGSAKWQIRLTTEHRNGRTREARFELDLD